MRTLLLTCMLYFIAFSVGAEENRFLTASITRSRALAMGSACHSLIDDFSAGLYNPGSFKLNNTREEKKFRLFFNPIGMSLAFYDYSKYNRDFEQDDKLSIAEGLLSVSMLLKGAVFTTQLFDFGISLGEEIITDNSSLKHNKRFFSIERYTYSSFTRPVNTGSGGSTIRPLTVTQAWPWVLSPGYRGDSTPK